MEKVTRTHAPAFIERPIVTRTREEFGSPARRATCVWIETALWERVKALARWRSMHGEKRTAADLVNASVRGFIGTLDEWEA